MIWIWETVLADGGMLPNVPTPPVSDMLSWIVAILLIAFLGLLLIIFQKIIPAKEAQISTVSKDNSILVGKMIDDANLRYDKLILSHSEQVARERSEAAAERNMLYDRYSVMLKEVQEANALQNKLTREEFTALKLTVQLLTEHIVKLAEQIAIMRERA